MRYLVGFYAFLGLLAAAAAADNQRPADKPPPDVVRAVEEQLAAQAGLARPAAKPLPELRGVVPWKTLAQVSLVRQRDRFVPEFAKDVVALDRKEVKLQGYMMPLDMGERQKRFLLVAMPPSCAYCLPGGPEQVVEVQARSPVKHGLEAIVVSGRLALVKDDPMGLFYRLTEAVAVER